jgi:hypothetical protein
MSDSEEKRSHRLSSYTLLIAESILRQFNINIDSNTLINELDNKNSVYSVLCQAPMLCIMNDLISAQIKSYQQFIQKKMIDYYANNPPIVDEQGDSSSMSEYYPDTVAVIKQKFLDAQNASKSILQLMYDNSAFINKTIFKYVNQQIIRHGNFEQFNADELNGELMPLVEQAEGIKSQLISERANWREMAADYTQNLSAVSIYQMNELEDLELRAELDFFSQLGNR